MRDFKIGQKYHYREDSIDIFYTVVEIGHSKRNLIEVAKPVNIRLCANKPIIEYGSDLTIVNYSPDYFELILNRGHWKLIE
jgi:hypothetical protein